MLGHFLAKINIDLLLGQNIKLKSPTVRRQDVVLAVPPVADLLAHLLAVSWMPFGGRPFVATPPANQASADAKCPRLKPECEAGIVLIAFWARDQTAGN